MGIFISLIMVYFTGIYTFGFFSQLKLTLDVLRTVYLDLCSLDTWATNKSRVYIKLKPFE